MECLWPFRGSSLSLLRLSTFLFLSFLRSILVHNPGHHDVLLVAFIPASPAIPLLEGPDIYQRLPFRIQMVQYSLGGFDATLWGGQVVDDGDGDGEIEGG